MVLAKSNNMAFIIEKDKSKEFKKKKRSSKLNEILKNAKLLNIN